MLLLRLGRDKGLLVGVSCERRCTEEGGGGDGGIQYPKRGMSHRVHGVYSPQLLLMTRPLAHHRRHLADSGGTYPG